MLHHADYACIAYNLGSRRGSRGRGERDSGDIRKGVDGMIAVSKKDVSHNLSGYGAKSYTLSHPLQGYNEIVVICELMLSKPQTAIFAVINGRVETQVELFCLENEMDISKALLNAGYTIEEKP